MSLKLIYSALQISLLHIDLGPLTSHSTSRTLRHIQLSYSRVIHLNFSFAAFMSLFVFWLVWVLFAWLLWMLALWNPEGEGSIFLSENCHFYPVTILESFIVQFWGTLTVGLENCAITIASWNCGLCNSSSEHPTYIMHYVISATQHPSETTQISFCTVLASSLLASREKLRNPCQSIPWYVSCHSSSFLWFSLTS